MIVFGAGNVFVKESSGTNPKTIKVAGVKLASLDISEETIKLYGQSKYPKDVANGQATMTGKLSLSEVDTNLLGAILAGSAVTTGYEELVTDPPAAIPTTPFTITVAGATGFKDDYGVQYSDTKIALTPVATGPAAGQYSFNSTTGVYTFSSADQTAGKSVEISYTKTVTGSGSTLAYTNQLMGAGTVWKLRLWNTYNGKKVGIYLPAVKIGKAGLSFDTTSHSQPEHDFEVFESSEIGADGRPLVFKLYTA